MKQHPPRLIASLLSTLALTCAHAVAVDLGDASRFSALTFGNFTGYSGDTSSLLAVGGNASLTNWTVNDHAWPGYGGYTFITAGNFTGTSGVVVGNSFVGGTATLTSFNAGTVGTGTSPLDFTALQSQLTTTSATTAATAATGTVDYQGGSTLLTGSNRDVEIFAIDGNQLSQDTYLAAVSGIKTGATVILNVSGTTVSMASFGIDLPNQGTPLNLLFNFYEATTLSFANLAIEGAVLAPYAAVTGTSGHIGGTFVAQSFQSVGKGNFEFHDISFTPVAVPEPEQWALWAAGLLLLLPVARQRAAARRR